MRDELLAIEQFDSLLEAQVLIADWRDEYNHYRPHSALGIRRDHSLDAQTERHGQDRFDVHAALVAVREREDRVLPRL